LVRLGRKDERFSSAAPFGSEKKTASGGKKRGGPILIEQVGKKGPSMDPIGRGKVLTEHVSLEEKPNIGGKKNRKEGVTAFVASGNKERGRNPVIFPILTKKRW